MSSKSAVGWIVERKRTEVRKPSACSAISAISLEKEVSDRYRHRRGRGRKGSQISDCHSRRRGRKCTWYLPGNWRHGRVRWLWWCSHCNERENRQRNLFTMKERLTLLTAPAKITTPAVLNSDSQIYWSARAVSNSKLKWRRNKNNCRYYFAEYTWSIRIVVFTKH